MLNVPNGAAEMALALEMPLLADAPKRDQSSLTLLIERATKGDTAAFDQIMIQSEQRVMAISWRMLGNEADARDATQEVFLRVYKYLKRFRPNQDFFAWLYGITINVCRDLLKKRQRQSDRFNSFAGDENEDALALPAQQENAEQLLLQSQRRKLISRAIAILPVKERAAIVLRDVEGLTTDEVARILKSSPTTVRSQISSARVKIRDYCRRYSEDLKGILR